MRGSGQGLGSGGQPRPGPAAPAGGGAPVPMATPTGRDLPRLRERPGAAAAAPALGIPGTAVGAGEHPRDRAPAPRGEPRRAARSSESPPSRVAAKPAHLRALPPPRSRRCRGHSPGASRPVRSPAPEPLLAVRWTRWRLPAASAPRGRSSAPWRAGEGGRAPPAEGGAWRQREGSAERPRALWTPQLCFSFPSAPSDPTAPLLTPLRPLSRQTHSVPRTHSAPSFLRPLRASLPTAHDSAPASPLLPQHLQQPLHVTPSSPYGFMSGKCSSQRSPCSHLLSPQNYSLL